MYLFHAILIHVQRNFMPHALSCGIKARLHDLRHSAVTYMLKNKIPIFIIQSKRINRWLLSVRHKKGRSPMTRLFVNGLIFS
jgi:hypothetical protein